MRKSWETLCVLAFNFLLGTSMAHGDSQKDPCDGSSTQDMHSCAITRFENEDKKLNDLYKKLRLNVGKGTEAEKALINAQKAWLLY